MDKVVSFAMLTLGIVLVIVGLGGAESHIAGHFGIRGIFHPIGHIQCANMSTLGRVLMVAMGLFISFGAVILLGSMNLRAFMKRR